MSSEAEALFFVLTTQLETIADNIFLYLKQASWRLEYYLDCFLRSLLDLLLPHF